MSDREVTLALMLELREDIGRWTVQPDLSRVLIAQINHAERLLQEGKALQARPALETILVGVKAAGPRAWGKGVDHMPG